MLSNSACYDNYRIATRRHDEDLSTAAARRRHTLLSRQPGVATRLRNLLGTTLIAIGTRLIPAPATSRNVHQATAA